MKEWLLFLCKNAVSKPAFHRRDVLSLVASLMVQTSLVLGDLGFKVNQVLPHVPVEYVGGTEDTSHDSTHEAAAEHVLTWNSPNKCRIRR